MKKISLLLIIIMMLTFSGCWDSIETEKLAVVSLLGVDVTDDGNFKVTLQELSSKNQSMGMQPSGTSKTSFYIYSEEGSTISEAIQKISSSQHKDIYFGHTKIIILSEELARSKGFEPVIDFYRRTSEMRLKTYLLVAKEGQFEKIMSTDAGLNTDTGTMLEETISNDRNVSYITASELKDVVEMFWKPGSEPFTSGINILSKNSNNKINIKDTAVFKGSKMIGWLDDKESIGLSLSQGNVKGGIMSIPYEGSKVSLRIIRNSSEIHPIVSSDKIQINMIVNVTSYISESHGKTDFLDTNVVEKVQEAQKQEIKNEITSAINHSKSLNSDIFEFGSYINIYYPKFWKQIKDNWDSYYPNLQINIDVRTSIRNIGANYKTLR